MKQNFAPDVYWSLRDISSQAIDLLEDISDIVSDNERNYIKECIDSKAIPTPKLLIKDHKDLDEEGNYPTRLVVPATL